MYIIKKIKKRDGKRIFSLLGIPVYSYYREKFKKISFFDFDNANLIKEIPDSIEFEKEDNPLVSIIIPVYNNYFYTKQCLASIKENVKSVSFEIILADDNSTDDTTNILNEIKNINVVKNQKEKGFLQNCNYASQYAKGKYILFLNNDTQVMQDWLESLIHTMESDDKIGLVGSKLVYPDGMLQEAGGIVYSNADGCNFGRNKNPNALVYNYLRETDYISGASIMLKNSIWKELGGFDERYSPAYYEDTDLAFRIKYEKKLKVVYQPKSVVIHYEGKSNGTDLSSGLKQYQVVNKEKFYNKWQKELKENHFENSKCNFFAKDSAKNKKNVLVIDWGVLTYSKDTGSRTTYQYMKFFKDCGFNVKYFPHNFSLFEKQFLRDHLSDGFELIYAEFDDFIKKYGQNFDYVYLNRPNIAPHYIKSLRKYTKATILYQCHDLHYLRQYRERLLNKNKKAARLLLKEKKAEFNIFKQMDLVCSFSCDEVAEINKEDVSVKAQQIPLFILDKQEMQKFEYNPQERSDIVFVAGFSHNPNVDATVWFTKNIFPKISAKIPDIKFYIVGNNPKPEVLELQSGNVVVTGFVSEERLEEIYAKAKIVVVPLRFGAGVKGKIVEALFNKVPVVTTSIGIEGIPNKDNFINICDDADDFAKETIELYLNDEELLKKSKQCEFFIKENYTFEAAQKSLSEFVDFGGEK